VIPPTQELTKIRSFAIAMSIDRRRPSSITVKACSSPETPMFAAKLLPVPAGTTATVVVSRASAAATPLTTALSVPSPPAAATRSASGATSRANRVASPASSVFRISKPWSAASSTASST